MRVCHARNIGTTERSGNANTHEPCLVMLQCRSSFWGVQACVEVGKEDDMFFLTGGCQEGFNFIAFKTCKTCLSSASFQTLFDFDIRTSTTYFVMRLLQLLALAHMLGLAVWAAICSRISLHGPAGLSRGCSCECSRGFCR